MKKLFFLFLIPLFSGVLMAQNFKPVKKSRPDICPACVQFNYPDYKSIADTVKFNPIVEHWSLTKAQVDSIDALNINRDTISFHGDIGVVNTTGDYNDSGFDIGHIRAFKSSAYSPRSARQCMIPYINCAPEWHLQNVGTEEGSEDEERADAIANGLSEMWGGTFASLGILKAVTGKNKGKISAHRVNIPAVFWKIIVSGGNTVVYWMPNSKTGTKRGDLPGCKKTIAELIVLLGFDPQTALK